ncbi:MAG: hypothetical protein KatS3mg032_0431 [Cyclobacteriaceae bacterium]|nr:MAG: hypothetical protein KatS3mg032_0431 [Cyclobacteriaceae bacterium]
MKYISAFGPLMVLAVLVLTLSHCGKDNPAPPAEQVQLDKLKKTWNLVSVTLDGADKKAPAGQIQTSFALTISGTFNTANPKGPYNFTVTGTEAPSPWPPSGTWLFGDDAESQIIRQNDNVAITYSISPSGQLTLTFVCSGCNYPGARTETVDGNWVFVLE